MSTDLIELWHQRARPNPTPTHFDTQLGCHFEEFVEMLETLSFQTHGETFALTGLINAMREFGDALKQGEIYASIRNRKEFLDSIADQVVTGIGAAHCAGMKASEAVARVNTSNWSKFDADGQPIFNEHGKIAKGPQYAPPDLEGLY